ncbi:MAG: PadR family transcriptional regulator [Anaerolineae bacterium]
MGRKPTVEDLLENWEGAYKKGLLSLWLLLFLHARPAYAYELSAAVRTLSQGTITADDNSIYRALNRFEALGVVNSELRQSAVGPQRRYYQLTETGLELLRQFIQRNILVFEQPEIAARLQAVVNAA